MLQKIAPTMEEVAADAGSHINAVRQLQMLDTMFGDDSCLNVTVRRGSDANPLDDVRAMALMNGLVGKLHNRFCIVDSSTAVLEGELPRTIGKLYQALVVNAGLPLLWWSDAHDAPNAVLHDPRFSTEHWPGEWCVVGDHQRVRPVDLYWMSCERRQWLCRQVPVMMIATLMHADGCTFVSNIGQCRISLHAHDQTTITHMDDEHWMRLNNVELSVQLPRTPFVDYSKHRRTALDDLELIRSSMAAPRLSNIMLNTATGAIQF